MAEVRMAERVDDEGKELLHIAQACRPLHQRAHRRAIALHFGIDADHIAGIEAEGLHHIQPIGGVVEGERVGRQHQAGRRRLRAGDGDLIERLVQLRGQSRLIGKERERQSERRAACGCTISSGLPSVSLYFFRIQCFTCAPRLVKTILYCSFSTVVSVSERRCHRRRIVRLHLSQPVCAWPAEAGCGCGLAAGCGLVLGLRLCLRAWVPALAWA